MNLIWAANIQTMKKYKHAEYYEISYTERIIVKYSTQACRHSWNIQHRANLKKEVFKAQWNPDRQASASQLSLQHQHTWHGSTNTQQNRFAQFQYGSIWNLSRFEYFFGVVNSEYFPLGRQQWVLYEKPLTVELFRPEGQLSNILLQVVLQNISGQAALQK